MSEPGYPNVVRPMMYAMVGGVDATWNFSYAGFNATQLWGRGTLIGESKSLNGSYPDTHNNTCGPYHTRAQTRANTPKTLWFVVQPTLFPLEAVMILIFVPHQSGRSGQVTQSRSRQRHLW